MQLIQYEDPTTSLLRYDIAMLNYELDAINLKIVDFHNKQYEFEREYQNRLGDIADAVLQLRIELGMAESINNAPVAITQLADEAFDYLKRCFRLAAKLCHPDYLDDKHKHVGLELFDALNKAYHLQDIVTVAHILWLLESEQAFSKTPIVLTSQDLLERRKELLELMITQNTDQLEQLKMREDYDVSNRDNWNILLYDYQTQLEDELVMLRARIKHKKSEAV